MNAKEAREISEGATQTDASRDIESLLEIVYKKIAASARLGGFSISNPFYGLRLFVSEEDCLAVTERLVADGFTVYRNGRTINRIIWATF